MKKIILIAVIFLVSLMFSGLKVTQYLELKTEDIRFNLRGARKPPPNIVIVDIDDDSYDALKMRFPWDRRIYGKLLKNLKKAKAKMVIFDIEFDIPDKPEEDSIFAAAIKDFGNVVMGGALKTGITSTIVYPIKPFLKYSKVGMLNKLYDADGVVRRYPLRLKCAGNTYNSVALTAFSLLYRKQLPVSDIVNMDFYGPPRTFSYYSFWTAVDDSTFLVPGVEDTPNDVNAFDELLQDSVFYNKIVFVGASIAEFHDLDQTPFYNYKGSKNLMPGVELHATMLANLIEGRWIKKLPYYFNILFLIILAVISSFLPYDRIYLSLFFTIFIIILIILLSIIAFIKDAYIQLMPLLIVSVFGYAGGMIERFIKTRKEKQWITSIFGRYVSKEIVSTILKKPEIIHLGGEKRRVSILFSDIEGFTTFSEKISPEEVVKILNVYLERLTDVVIDHKGMVDKFEGDAIMAVFGVPISLENNAEMTVLCGLKMQEEIEKMVKAEEIPPLKTRIGINTGDVIAGNLGSRQRMDYTVMGDAVNLASRLEGINKFYGTKILIGEDTYKEIKGQILCREIDRIRVKGKETPISIYEPISEALRTLKEKYENGLKLYRNKEWGGAKKIFSGLIEEYGDNPSEVMLKRIQVFEESPPQEDWDGVFTFYQK